MYPSLQGLPHGDLDLSEGIPTVALLKRAWRLFFTDGNIFLAFFLYTLVVGGAGMIPFGSLIVAGPLLLGLNAINLRWVRGEKPQVTVLFDGFKLFGLGLAVYLLLALIMMGGVLLCFVGAFIFVIWYFFLWFIIADGERQVWPSFVRAKELVQGYFWQLVLFMFISGLFNIAGLLCCVVGVFITAPITMLAQAMLYDLLCAHKGRGLRDPEYVKRYWEMVQQQQAAAPAAATAVPVVGPIVDAEPVAGPVQDQTPPAPPTSVPLTAKMPVVPPPVEVPPSPQVPGESEEKNNG